MKTLSRPTPDYGFEHGIQTSVISYRAHTFGRSELEGLPNAGQDAVRDRSVEQQMRTTRLEGGLGGKAIEFAFVEQKEAKRTIIPLYGWGGMTQHPVAIGEAQALAAANPDANLVFINTPGAGRSEALPRSVQNEIMRSGHYGLLGEHLALATESVWRDSDSVHLYGHSLGGRTAIGMAPFIEGGVDRLVVNDPTGARQISLANLALNFMLREKLHLDNYVRAGFDPQASERQRSPVAKAVQETHSQMRGSLFQMLVVDPIGLTRGGLEHDMELALPNVNQLTRVLSPELSEINDWRYMAEVLARVAKFTKGDAEVEQWILNGHTHSFMAAAPGVEAFLYAMSEAKPHR